MTALAMQQQALLAALWRPRHADALETAAPHLVSDARTLRGLQAYRSNGHELATRVLAAAFPVLTQLLGHDNFGYLARSFWQAHPPVRGDMAQWGAGMAAHIEVLPQLADEPYLADVARLEWLLHAAATAADVSADPATFALLAELDPSQLTLTIAPGMGTVESPYAVASVVLAHLQHEPTMAQAGERLRNGVAETALVWRQGLKPVMRHAVPGEAAFVRALKEKQSLADSLSAAPELDFNQWLLPAVHSGLVVRAASMQTT